MSKKRQKSRFWLLIMLFLVPVVMVAGVLGYSWHWLQTPFATGSGQPSVFELGKGETLSHAVRRLAADHNLQHPQLLKLYARLVDQSGVIRGEYEIPAEVSPLQLLQRLHDGEVILRSITFVEGINFRQLRRLLAEHPAVSQTLTDVSAKDIAEQLSIPYENPEGWFYPDTYHFVKGTSDLQLLDTAFQRMRNVLDREWQQKDSGLPYSNAYEALIMASIVEKETGAAHERQQIAGVFVRRLQKKMRLQTDPTVIYGLGEDYAGDIKRSHLKQATPYNTYVIRGLPPTPIALPGREAIHAAMHPAAGETLYFVAKGDGTHVFSKTLEEHSRAVRQYQLSRRDDYRSSFR